MHALRAIWMVGCLVACHLVAHVAGAASFDCAKATTPVEHLICSHPELSAADTQLEQVYRDLLRLTSETERYQSEERQWLRTVRDTCHTGSCLLTVYQERLASLDSQRQRERTNACTRMVTLHGETLEACTKAREQYAQRTEHCYEEVSEAWDGRLYWAERACIATVMRQALHSRERALNVSNAPQARLEVQVHNEFAAARERFCQFYAEKCAEARCVHRVCHALCYYTLDLYRARQVRELGRNALTIAVGKRQPVWSSKYFEQFADDVCQLPAAVWKGQQRPKDCKSSLFSEIETSLEMFVVEYADEFEACAAIDE